MPPSLRKILGRTLYWKVYFGYFANWYSTTPPPTPGRPCCNFDPLLSSKYNLHQFNLAHRHVWLLTVTSILDEFVRKGNQLPTLTSSITWTSTSMLWVSHLDLSISMYQETVKEVPFLNLPSRWLNTVLRAVSGNSRDHACNLDKQTWWQKPMVHRRWFLKLYSLKFCNIRQNFCFYCILNNEDFKMEVESKDFVTHLIITIILLTV